MISGGVELTGWTAIGGNIYSTPVPAGADFRQVYVNDRRAELARTPNTGSYYTIASYDEANKKVAVRTEDLNPAWSGFESTVSMVHLNEWVDSILRVSDSETSGELTTLTFKDPERGALFGRLYPEKVGERQKYYWINSYDFLDAEGEWFLDKNQNTLYYKLRADEDIATINVVIPQTETLMKLVGTSTTNTVHDIEIYGIAFMHTNWTVPNNGYSNVQAGLPRSIVRPGYIERPGSPGVLLKNASNISIIRSKFILLGSTGLDIYTGTRDINISGNIISDIAGTGIIVSKLTEFPYGYADMWNPVDPLEPAQLINIENNYITRVAQDYYGAVGILIGYARSCFIGHNQLSDLPYTGISVGWGWSNADSVLSDNIVEANYMYNVVNMMADGGAIYTLSKNSNSRIQDNYIHDLYRNKDTGMTYPVRGIYLDQGSEEFTIVNNVVHNVPEVLGGHLDHNVIVPNTKTDAEIIAAAGIEPAFRDIIPGVIRHDSNVDWVAAGNDIVSLSGTVTLADQAADTVTASVYRNGTELLWSAETNQAGAQYDLYLELEPGDTISFAAARGETAADEDAIWNSLIVSRIFSPQLIITDVDAGFKQVGEALIDDITSIITVFVEEDTNLASLDPVFFSPRGTVVEPAPNETVDFSGTVVYRVTKEASLELGGAKRYRDWKVNIVKKSEKLNIRGYNIANSLADTDGWYMSTGGTKTAGVDSLTLSNGYAIYQGETFGNELLEFNMKPSQSGWPSITLRNQSATASGIGGDSASYIVVIRPEAIELHRFNQGVRTVFYGNLDGYTSLYGDEIPNTVFDYSRDNHVQVGAINTEDGVRLIMNVNGQNVFDCIDSEPGRIVSEGYFGTYQAGSVIKLAVAPAIRSMKDTIANADGWYVSTGGTKTAGTGSLSLSNGYAIYQDEMFGDELLEFNMKPSQSGWPSITLRNQSATASGIGAASSSYIVVIRPEVIELHRFNQGARTVFYGNLEGYSSLYGDAIPNTVFDYSRDNHVQIGAINTDDGVRLILNVNGRSVIDCIDSESGRIASEGYFGTYQAGSTIRLAEPPTIVNISETIADGDGWFVSGGGTKTVGTGNVKLSNGYAIYQGETFGNELLEFNMKTNRAAWPSIMLRNQSTTANGIGASSASYIMIFKAEGIELHRFNQGVRTVFYGNLEGYTSLFGDALPITAFDYTRDNLVQAGAINTDDGVRLILNVNGKSIIDCIDSEPGRITSAGYFGTYQASNTIRLSQGFYAVAPMLAPSTMAAA
ncbi:right-handed parallel beta-helix repeat-containing protein [Paenibacillus luteus]|uniref:right-handed parallel beta-helix repeat-containing protein n=1 Tax=Paenibacillus luteus TaxID=2545753 RepID=UPI0011433201|nr:right-handed parallel beta-helix repeat-containing protein [Paenibacillus luteus]